MKKTILIPMSLIMVIMFGFFIGCSGVSTTTTEATEDTIVTETTEETEAAEATEDTTENQTTDTGEDALTGLKVAVNLFLGSNEWNASAAQGIIDTFGTSNDVTTIDANGDVQKAAENLLTLVASKPDLIIVTIGDNASFQQGIMAAADAGIPIIDIEAGIYGPTVMTHIWADQAINGIMDANNIVSYLASTHGGLAEGNVLECYNPTVSTLSIRRDACLAKLALFQDINVLEPLPYDQTNPTDTSRVNVEAYLQANSDKVDIITGYFGEVVVGATEAIENLGLGDKIKVAGIDAFEPVLNQMRQGKPVIAAVQQDGYAIGVVGAKLGMKVLAGENIAFQYIMPLTSVYNSFPGKADNFPAEGKVKISCPQEYKDEGLDWGY